VNNDRCGAALYALKHHQQRNDDQRRDHQQFVVVDIGDDLRLTGDKRVE
jgi:hypothetical protein